jgi:DNA-binding NtrC family response regulator
MVGALGLSGFPRDGEQGEYHCNSWRPVRRERSESRAHRPEHRGPVRAGGLVPAQQETLQIQIDSTRVLISRSPAIAHLWELVQRVARSDVSVVITGETGTGKELVARLIHQLSPRKTRDFVAVDCNAVAPTLLESELFGHERGAFTGADRQRVGVFEMADGATLFLDEISNLLLAAQAKFLRVLQEREFRRLGGRQLIQTDFRLITATNADLGTCVRAGTFREDLFHRLQVVDIQLPPLRERREDIAPLVSYFIERNRLRLGRPGVQRVRHEALDLLRAYDWPGNVRELEHVVERAIIECPGDTIETVHLVCGTAVVRPGPSTGDFDLPFRSARQRAMATFETLYLLSQLRRYHGSIKNTARHAGVTSKHVRELMKRYAIDRHDFRRPVRRQTTRPATAVVLHERTAGVRSGAA